MNPKDLRRRIKAEIAKDVSLSLGEDEQEHHERHWPERIERQAAAFRRILKRHKPIDLVEMPHASLIVCTTCRQVDAPALPSSWPCPEIIDLAAIYNIATATPAAAEPMRVAGTTAHVSMQHPAAIPCGTTQSRE